MALDAFGTKFEVGDGAEPEVFTAVAEVHDISGMSVSRDSIETTHHGSADGFREYLPGLKDGGEVTIGLNFDPTETTHNALFQAIGGSQNVNTNYQVVFPDTGSTAFAFSGHVTGFDITAPIDDRLTATVTFKVSGKPTLS